MLVPVVITAGVLGLLYASRETSTSAVGPGPVPFPVTPPGALAQVGDTVEVAPGAVGDMLQLRVQFPTIPQEATITGVFVRVDEATATTLAGMAQGLSYATANGTGSAGVPFGGYRTPPFPRPLVAHVYRNGERLA